MNALPEDLDRTNENTEGCGNVLGSRSGRWATPPPECLSLIFEAGLECVFPEGDFNEETTDDDDLCQYIYTITLTSRWWRQVALDTPRLWRVLILNDTTPLKKLETWLERSKAAPLCINLQEDLEPSSRIAAQIVPLLLEHINHWGRFLFVSAAPWGLSNFLKAVEGKGAPLLQELVLSQGATGDTLIWEPSPISALKLFNGPNSVPKLVDFDFWRIPLDWNNSPFRNLQALSLARMQDGDKLTVEQFMDLLRESPQLVQLALVEGVVQPDRLTAAFNRGDQTPQPISLPSLVVVLISDYPASDILNLTFRLMRAPNLEKLMLANLNLTANVFDVDFSSTFEALGSGALSSFEHLTTLELRRISCRSRAAWDLFCTKLTGVRHMALGYVSDGPAEPDNGGDVYAGYLSGLLRHIDEVALEPASDMTLSTQKVVCSNLQTIFLSGCSQRTVVDFARRRRELGYGMAQVIYGGTGEPPVSIIDELQEMGVECGWCSDIDTEAGSDSEADDG